MEKNKERINFLRRLPLSRSIRLPDYDYTKPGAYFVTICTFKRKSLFGFIHEGEVVLNSNGKIAQLCWDEIKNHFSGVELPVCVVMPNHLHGIIIIKERVATRHAVSNDFEKSSPPTVTTSELFGKPVDGSLPTIIRSFKSAVTKQVNISNGNKHLITWQEGYYEHVIRDEREFVQIAEYVLYNPMKWETDRENPNTINKTKPLPFEY